MSGRARHGRQRPAAFAALVAVLAGTLLLGAGTAVAQQGDPGTVVVQDPPADSGTVTTDPGSTPSPDPGSTPSTGPSAGPPTPDPSAVPSAVPSASADPSPTDPAAGPTTDPTAGPTAGPTTDPTATVQPDPSASASVSAAPLVPPAPAVFTAEPAGGPGTTVVWTWEQAQDGVPSCTVAPAPVELTCAPGTASAVLPLVEGEYRITVVLEGAGGPSPPATSAPYRLGRPPAAPDVTLQGQEGAQVSWGWAQPVDVTGATCTLLDGGGRVLQAPTACTSPFPVTLPGDGAYALEVVLTDPDGDSPAGRSLLLDLDLPSPDAFDVTGPTGPGNQPSVVYGWPVVGTSQDCTLLTGSTRTVVPCANGTTTTLPADGLWQLEVVQRGPGGTTTGLSPVHELDTQAPPAPVLTSAPPAAGTGTSPAWTFTSDAPTTCAVPGVTVAVPCAGTYSAPLDGQTDGSYTLEVVARDAAGNTAGVSGSYVLDRQPPEAPVLTARQAVRGTGLSPQWAVAAEGRVTCVLTGPTGSALQNDTGCTSPYTMPLVGRTDGVYTLTATTVDAAGNVSDAATASYELDTTGPVVTVAGPTGDGNDTAPVWTWTATEAVSAASCTLLLTGPTGTSAVGTAACLGGTYTPTLPGDGAYSVRVEVADLLGTPGSAVSGTYRLDATAPDLPVVTGPEGPSTDTTVTWSWTGVGTPTCGLTRDALRTPVACTGNALDATLPGSGTWVFDVALRDEVGNTSATGSSPPYVVDVTPPGVPAVAVTATGSSRTPSWTVVADPDATLECRLTAPGGPAAAWASCTSPHAPLLDGEDGSWRLEVRAADALGNTSEAGSAVHLLDTEAPSAPEVRGPIGLDNDPRPVWTWDEVPGTTAQCQLLPHGALQPCSGGSFAPALPGDGSYAAVVQLTDVAGNVGEPGTSASYVFDGTPPARAQVTGPTGPGNAASVSWAISGEGTARCRLERGGEPGGWNPCTGGFSTQLDVDGSWVLEVELTDEAGNSSTTRSAAYLLDRVAPGVPTVTGPRGPSREPLVTWTVSTEPGTVVECRLTGPEPSAWQTCGPTVTRTLALDGTHVLEARLVDEARNTGPVGAAAGFVLDRTAPPAPAVGGPTGPSSGRTPTWTFELSGEAVSAECALRRDGVVVQDWHSCASPSTRDLTGSADGRYALAVRLTDAAGNVGPVGTSTPYVLDTTAPAAPVVTGPTAPSRDPAPAITFAGEPDTSGACRAVRAGTPAGDFTACTSPWAAPLQGDGTWTAQVRLTDAAGNTGEVASSAGWVLDTVAPARPEVSAPKSPGRDTAPTWSVVAEEGAALSCRTTSPAGATSAWAPCTFPHTTDLGSGPDGEWALEVRATDQAGGTSEVGRALYLLDTTLPVAPTLAAPPSPSRNRAPSFGIQVGTGETASCRLSRGGVVLQDWASCTSPAVLILTALPDGAYTLTVRATDEAGGTGPVATATYVMDTTAPAPPTLTDLPATPNPSVRPRFSFTAERDASTTCRVRGPDDRLLRDEVCVSPWTPDLSGAADGPYRISVLATDTAGNTSEPVTTTYQLDSTAPDAAVVTAPTSPGTGRSPVWTIAAAGPAECRLTRGATVLSDWRSCVGSFSADLTSAPDGTYVLSVRLRDVAGNTSAVTTSRYVLDTEGAAPARLTSPPTPSSSRTPTWVVASPEEGVRAECLVLSGSAVVTDWTSCAVSAAGEPFSLDLTGQADGTWTLVVRLIDAAGNTGGEQRSTYELDTVPPGGVSVAEPGTPSADTTPTWLLTAGPGETLACRLTSGGAVLQDWAPCTSPYTVDLTGKPDATYTLTVRAVDAAGNIGPDRTSAYRLDASAPLAPGAVVGPTGPSTDRQPTWTFVLEPGSTATCVVTRGRATLRSGPCRSPYTLDLTGQPDGSYTLTVRAVDAAGNAGPASPVGYVLDTTAPEPPTFTLEPGTPSATTTPRWGWSTPAGATSQCRSSSASGALLEWATCTSPWTAALSDAPDGSHGLQVRAVDTAGNTSTPVSGEYRLDRTAGLLAEYASVPPPVGADRTPTWGLQVERGQLLECRLVGPDATSPWGPCGTADGVPPAGTRSALELTGAGTHTVSLAGRPDGAYALELRSVPRGGTPGPASRSTYRLDTTPPAPATLTSGPTGDEAGTDATPAWSWEADPAAIVQCRLVRDGDTGAPFAPCSSPFLADLRQRGEATYVLELRSVDAAGNAGDVVRGSYRYDTTPPPAAVFVGRPVPATGGRTVSWAFTQPDGTDAACTVSRDGQAVAEQPCARGYVFVVGDRGLGTYTLSVVLRDTAGNVGPPARSVWVMTAGAVPSRVDDGTSPAADPGPAPAPGRPAATFATAFDGATPVPPRQGPALPVGPGTPVPVGPQLTTVAVGRPVDTPGARVREAATTQVERVVERLRDALPETITLPRPAEVPEAIGRVFGETFRNAAREPTLPLTVLLVVVVFLLVQNRIDRRDPKLASAPVEAEPELSFGPVHRTRVDQAGVTA